MSLLRRRFVLVAVLTSALLGTSLCTAELPVTFESPHVARGASAALDFDYSRDVDAQIEAATLDSVDELVRFALGVTGAHLHFGLEHQTTLRFGTKEREANCIEYAHLFATVFNRAAARKKLAARAHVVHSDARVLGMRLPGRGLADHDWVLVVPTTARAPKRYVDPTFFDMGLDWDIARNVSGDVP